MRFEGRVALVTGASRGIGRGIVARLVAEGARVVATGRTRETLDALAGELGRDQVLAVPGKADDPEHHSAAVAAALDTFGRLDHLVNNAGINPVHGPALGTDESAIRKIFQVNVLAAAAWTRAALDAGLGRDGGASVVNTASVAGLAASPGIAWYGVSKAALINLTQQLALELAPAVRVNAVAPGVVRTRFAGALFEGREDEVAARHPLRRIGEPEDIAGPVAFLLSGDAAWITGQTLVVDGGAAVHGL
jgi:NAD(P)-dependent dehydrogenase (short-subunit alcohol dehydrogenase family)